MREWLVIESSYKNAVFATDDSKVPHGYIPRDAAEKLLGKDLGGMVWFTREESAKMREHPEWRETLPPQTRRWRDTFRSPIFWKAFWETASLQTLWWRQRT